MSGENENANREDIHSKVVRAGKRTYFFDVKSTRGNDLYLTITESKKRFHDNGKFSYEKHKLFLYKEDFDKFAEGLKETIEKIAELRAEVGSIYAEPIVHNSNHDTTPTENAVVEDSKEAEGSVQTEGFSENTSENGVAAEENTNAQDSDNDKFTSVSFEDLGENSSETKDNT